MIYTIFYDLVRRIIIILLRSTIVQYSLARTHFERQQAARCSARFTGWSDNHLNSLHFGSFEMIEKTLHERCLAAVVLIKIPEISVESLDES